MDRLNEEYLRQNLLGRHEAADFAGELLEYPERVLQIGEGNFLRAFFNWMLHEMNKKGVFKGRAAVVQPIPPGRVDELNEQDCLYTLLLRGIEAAEEKVEKEIITSISRGIKAYGEWEKVLKLAEDPAVEFVVSNTTEAGITYNSEDDPLDNPPESFPGKLTVFLKKRYDYFAGSPESGLVIIPVELIEKNGEELKKIVLRLADDWDFSPDFIDWVEEENVFFNTLVDRIVPGYPEEEAEEIEADLGYRDKNMTAGEIFHSWIIEGGEKHKEKLPFHSADLNVKWVDDLTPYRTRKVRILNGAHTSTVPVAYLCGVELVREAAEDDLLRDFIEKSMFCEIIPTLDFAEEELKSFAEKVLERFENPFIDHRWLDISLNSTSKFKTRVLPSLLAYRDRFDELPENLVFSLAALIIFYRGKRIDNEHLIAEYNGVEYKIQDDREAMEFFLELWNEDLNYRQLTAKVLSNESFWGRDLSEITGLVDKTTYYLESIDKEGMRNTLSEIIRG